VEGYFREVVCVQWNTTIGILFVASLDPQAFNVLYVLVEVSNFDRVKLHWIESVALRHYQNTSSIVQKFRIPRVDFFFLRIEHDFFPFSISA
jgi:hypothetical protein